MTHKIATDLTSKIKLNDGHMMPLYGLGVFDTHDTETAVLSAIKQGYRLIDTAEYYHNEKEVGTAVRKCDVPREELFVVSKLWDNGVEMCKSHFKATYKKLGLDYVDLYLIHSPYGGQNVATYKQMMEFQKEGLIRSIGVSNFGVQHLKGLMAAGCPKPTVNQIELHPWQQKRDIVQFCREQGITVMGYSPLAKGTHLGDDTLKQLAEQYSKTPAQIMIRWSVQNGFITIPKSSNPERIKENADVFNWSLRKEDMKPLDEKPQRSCTWNPCDSPWEG